ncbi:hypothetical protein EYF80_040510 [Liparis tanakae]|uniref:Uncharacterized protein n=1 Tax=Liparis tanakae TaxID=230148 RepID=A0A4Z2G8H7_9TELE|nr:hypothetical protein EYF80_040510 [Liparis tanakae]
MDRRVVLEGKPSTGKCARALWLHTTSELEGVKEQEHRSGQEWAHPASEVRVETDLYLFLPPEGVRAQEFLGGPKHPGIVPGETNGGNDIMERPARDSGVAHPPPEVLHLPITQPGVGSQIQPLLLQGAKRVQQACGDVAQLVFLQTQVFELSEPLKKVPGEFAEFILREEQIGDAAVIRQPLGGGFFDHIILQHQVAKRGVVEDICRQVRQPVPCEIQRLEVRKAPEEMSRKALQVVAVQVEPLQQGRGVQLLLGEGGDVRELDGQQGGARRETLGGVLGQRDLVADHLGSFAVAFAKWRAGQSAMAKICQREKSKGTPGLHD